MNKSRLIYLGVGQTSTPCKQGTGDPQNLPSISHIVDKGEHMPESMEVDQHEGMSVNSECDISPHNVLFYLVVYAVIQL